MRLKLTAAGVDFLKCALAPRDFTGIKAGGVPDNFSGKTMSYTFRSQFPITTVANNNFHCMGLPVPGTAFYYQNRPPGNVEGNWIQQQFPAAGALFGTGAYLTQHVTRFRIISHVIEVKPTSSVLNNSGVISAARLENVALNAAVVSDTPDISINGTADIVTGEPLAQAQFMSSMPGFYSGHFNLGVYGMGANNQGSWEWSDFFQQPVNIPSSETPNAGSSVNFPGVGGFGKFSAPSFSVEGVATGTTVSFVVYVEQCVEFEIRPGSMLANMLHDRLEPDPAALLVYNEAMRKLPSFVCAKENSGFWEKVLKVISAVAAGTAPLLGPYAPVAGAIAGVTGTLADMDLS